MDPLNLQNNRGASKTQSLNSLLSWSLKYSLQVFAAPDQGAAEEIPKDVEEIYGPALDYSYRTRTRRGDTYYFETKWLHFESEHLYFATGISKLDTCIVKLNSCILKLNSCICNWHFETELHGCILKLTVCILKLDRMASRKRAA